MGDEDSIEEVSGELALMISESSPELDEEEDTALG